MIDKTAFCDLIRLHEKTMYSLAYSVVGNEADAEDVICESILRAYKNIDMLKNEKAFKTWVLRIVHNTAFELIRKNSKTISLENVGIEKESYDEVAPGYMGTPEFTINREIISDFLSYN